ncbi:MAG: hypothetical protein JGK24_29115 [Microcoleus sp. PH2017_29_MFU_D_A]|uniref:hypothetical protein n=1 Tax=unclassified Microcoleus TaxID=2642155 RepID=UPI001DF1A6D8|nr:MULTISPECIES: hypothetical protein [unclassified Microcoleus]MCC3443721.1 hypothetical protein [Microcoleus sp. PH2017_03_ELD_O_A]TAE37273.1 MAG: hypothetical protein EAZ90_26905 [Oscillatoriales cyanobacterium]MCC3436312.1 hypothetical protein [Microcoleus sp. PH2017_05_CCC_O_A]MCC3537950.1 hypothetical protein [Microcoleus sp. PH2017_25_DOB_D_A]MCC3550325.1 hypothetical protein [Microcoleus sp. PH2017_24_DOB_U_A]
MKKKVVFLVCLLISAGLGGAVVGKSIAIPIRSLPNTLSADIPTPAADLSGLVLTLQDLPAGFTEMPPASLKRMGTGTPDFKPASVFGYQKSDDQQFQIVMGFTTQLPNAIDRSQFDAGVREEKVAQEFSKGLNSSNKEFNFANATPLSLEDKIGDVSSGWRSQGKIRGLLINVELVLFRRGKIGSFVAIIYLDGKQPTMTSSSTARQLDKRIMELKPDLTQPQ